ncbi:SRPBCC domain-containing protein [Neobacillus drentensis]|uniref:SRPBCC domain-containing protein n=1 Tax=Neobacillus drentensis TaxID=220684 RepID=UPI002FFFFB72
MNKLIKMMNLLAIGGETVEIEYQYRFGLPRTIVWKYIKNENLLKNSLQGCKSFIETSTGVYKGEIDIHLGPLHDLFNFDVQLDEEKAPVTLRLKIKGHGSLGELNGNAILLFKDYQSGTQILCKAKGEVSGALGLTGKRLLDSGATKGLENFFSNLEKEMKRTLYELKKRNR